MMNRPRAVNRCNIARDAAKRALDMLCMGDSEGGLDKDYATRQLTIALLNIVGSLKALDVPHVQGELDNQEYLFLITAKGTDDPIVNDATKG